MSSATLPLSAPLVAQACSAPLARGSSVARPRRRSRPRLPCWLEAALGDDPWLRKLAVRVLEWVGVTVTAPDGLWPLGSWARMREQMTGEPRCEQAQVAADVERVLTAMRTRPRWYADYVERPLGCKQAPLVPEQRSGDGGRAAEPRYLTHMQPDDRAEAQLNELAWAAVNAMEVRLGAGCGRGEGGNTASDAAEVRACVAEILAEVFGTGTGAEEMDRAPGDGLTAQQRIAALILEPEVLDRVVDAVVGIIETGVE